MILNNLKKKTNKMTMFVIENDAVKMRHGIVVNLRLCYTIGKPQRKFSVIVGSEAFPKREQAERKLALLELPQAVKYFAPIAAKYRKPCSDMLFAEFVKMFHRSRGKQTATKKQTRHNAADVAARKLIRASIADFQ